mmetsp:Transcript_29679/g.39629  ORF Transcript_29679/g.39629 Transcript_29679/m.39629 type:complete len:519 (+) Transcript_29679:97-1653(+)
MTMNTDSFIEPEAFTTGAALVLSILYFLVQFRRTSKINAKLSSHGPGVVLPPHVKSYIPFLGSAIEMGKGTRAFIAKYSARLNSPIFTAKIAGNHCLFIGDPDHVTMVYRYTKYLDDFTLQKTFTRNVLGIVDKADEYECFYSDGAKQINKKLYHKYLFSDEELTKSVGKTQKIFQDLLPNLLDEKCEGEWSKYSLFAMVREYVFKASVAPLISEYIATNQDVEAFRTFDKDIPLMFAEAPAFLTKKATHAREKLLENISNDKFMETGSELTSERKALFNSNQAFIRSTLGVLFASVGNSTPAVFWTLYHIIADEDALRAIRAEVDGIVKARSGTNAHEEPFALEELDKMVLTKSAFTEALRLYHGAFTTREVSTDFVFDPKKPGQSKYLIQKGTRIMAFAATLHHDPDLFHDNLTYKYDRFAPKMDKDGNVKPPEFSKNGKLISEPTRFFGGGAHLCPGRKFISYEMQALVAVLLIRFDMKLVASSDESPPQIDYSSQGVGVSHPDRDPTIMVRLRT